MYKKYFREYITYNLSQTTINDCLIVKDPKLHTSRNLNHFYSLENKIESSKCMLSCFPQRLADKKKLKI